MLFTAIFQNRRVILGMCKHKDVLNLCEVLGHIQLIFNLRSGDNF